MAKKAKQKNKTRTSSSGVKPSDLSMALPPGATPADQMAFQIMLNYVNGTGMTDIRNIVENSYRMADQFLKTFNERHDTTT